MANIESSPYPLAFPLAAPVGHEAESAPAADKLHVRTLARALDGMQKEALVTSTPGGRTWRMVCDEGPYLNGTDLAPFPLAFFATGLVNSYVAEILALAELRGVAIAKVEIVQDNFYTMEGSAVRGDMIGGALPVALHVRIDSAASAASLHELVMEAVMRSPADALLRGVFASEFSIRNNGTPLPVGEGRSWAEAPSCNLTDAVFDAARPDPSIDFPHDCIAKLGSAETVFNVEGGAGSSLRSEQKRTLHIRGVARLRDDGLCESRVQLFEPIGSNFRFLCDPQGATQGGRYAPSPLAYLSAGIAFCYLTQIGRYVTIMKYPLDRYAIAQDTVFGLATGRGAAGTPPSAEPVRTCVELASAADDDTVRKIVDMGERTCFLHAAARTPLKTRVHVTVETHDAAILANAILPAD